MPKTYTVKQVAQALGFSTNTVYKYLEEGKIKATRLGSEGRFKVSESEMLRLLGESGKVMANSTITNIESPTPQAIQPTKTTLTLQDHFSQLFTPDLFEWLISISAVFTGVSYFLFPIQYETEKLSGLSGISLGINIGLIIFGLFQIFADIFSGKNSPLRRFFFHLPLSLCFTALAWVSLRGEVTQNVAYFAVFAIFNLLSAFIAKHTSLKFIAFIYIFLTSSYLAYSQNPNHFMFSADFYFRLTNNPQLFIIQVVSLFTLWAGTFLFASLKSRVLFPIMSIITSLFFFAIATNFIGLQAWDKAMVNIIIGSFCLVFPFQSRLDSFARFSKKQAFASSLWLVTVLSVSLIVIYIIQNTSRIQSIQSTENAAVSAKSVIENYVSETLKLINSSSANKDNQKFFLNPSAYKPEDFDSIAKQIFLGSSKLTSVIISDQSGLIIGRYPISTTLPASIQNTEYFQKTFNSKQSQITDVHNFTNTPSTLLSSPVINTQDNEVIGVITGTLDLAKLGFRINQLKPESGGTFTLVDSNSHIIISQNSNSVGTSFSNKATTKALKGESGSITDYSESKTLSLQSFTNIPSLNWGLIVENNYSNIFKKSSVISLFVFVTSLSFGLTTLIVTAYLNRRSN